MDKLMKWMLIVGVVGMVLSMTALGYMFVQKRNAPVALPTNMTGSPAVPPISEEPILKIPAFSLVDQSGQARNASIFAGKITIADFMFTHCPLACPQMTMQLEKVQTRLKGLPVQIVSFSLDPEHDTPARLTEYATQRFKLDTSNWLFLTEDLKAGQKPALIARQMYKQNLKQYFEEDPAQMLTIEDGSGKQIPNINHSIRFFLLGPDGTVLGTFNSARQEEMDQLVERAMGAVKFHLKK
jgi:protein SCO1